MLTLRINRGNDIGFFLESLDGPDGPVCIGVVRSRDRVSLNLCFDKTVTIKRANVMTKEEFLAYESFVKDNVDAV